MAIYRTISFPATESGTSKIERARLLIPDSADSGFQNWIRDFSSKDVRFQLKQSYQKIKAQADVQKRSVSNYLFVVLEKTYQKSLTNRKLVKSSGKQLALFDLKPTTLGLHGTFRPNHKTSVHRWYPYVEGFSSDFVQSLLDEFAVAGSRIYDPFAGTGTTVTVAAMSGMPAFYSEVNPFMRLVIESKTNILRQACKHLSNLRRYFDRVVLSARNHQLALHDAQTAQHQVFGDRNYFMGQRLVEILSIKCAIGKTQAPSPACRSLTMLALGAIAVECSEMKRAADLRRRSEKELLPGDFSVLDTFQRKVEVICNDIDESFAGLSPVSCLSDSCLSNPNYEDYLDLLITSPPYANGTNYFRNTKIELWLNGFLRHESDLAQFRADAMAAGINNISKRGRPANTIPIVETYAKCLDRVAYDKRIPELVRRYFSDSKIWLENAHKLLRRGAFAIVDIGDSRFAGVHIPTDKLLTEIATSVGYKHVETRLVRKRKSKDGTTLEQVLIILQKTTGNRSRLRSIAKDNYLKAAEAFAHDLPHVHQPYSSRNWGHKLHSLCSYQGKLKPALAHFLVHRFTEPGERVLDPMSGCGTIPLESFLQGREAHGSDIQELAFILTKAKTSWGNLEDVRAVMKGLIHYVTRIKNKVDSDEFADFGFNGKLREYFHPETFREILASRKYLLANPCDSWARAIVYSSLFHILHGNRPYAMSRRSHPVTPLKPRGEFEYRPLETRLKAKVERTLALDIPKQVVAGKTWNLPFQELPYDEEVDVVITSPPFAASTRFYAANWMRLWLSGWDPDDFTSRREHFLEHQQKESMDSYLPFFEGAVRWLKKDGRLVMHVGRTASCNMASELRERGSRYFDFVYSFDEDVTGREKFGIRDQGATKAHQYLFFIKR